MMLVLLWLGTTTNRMSTATGTQPMNVLTLYYIESK